MAKKRRRPAKKRTRTENREARSEKRTSKATQKKRPAASVKAKAQPKSQPQPSSLTPQQPEYSYVGREIRQIVLITTFFVGVQIVLWVVFGRTGLEEKLIRLIAL